MAISASGFVFNPGNGDSFSVNPTGIRILELIKEEHSIGDIVTRLGKEFNVEESLLEQDIEDFVALVRQMHLLENE